MTARVKFSPSHLYVSVLQCHYLRVRDSVFQSLSRAKMLKFPPAMNESVRCEVQALQIPMRSEESCIHAPPPPPLVTVLSIHKPH